VKRPDFVLSSPLPRARETADIAAREFGKRVEVTEEAALAGGTVEEISRMLDRHPGDSTIAIVGHEPDLSELLARILGTEHAGRLTFKKGGAALVDLPGSALDGGALVWYLPPRLMRGVR
jgi:phosphohistidine phosphatase